MAMVFVINRENLLQRCKRPRRLAAGRDTNLFSLITGYTEGGSGQQKCFPHPANMHGSRSAVGNDRGLAHILGPALPIPKAPIRLRRGGLETRDINIAANAALLGAEGKGVFTLAHEAQPERDPVEIRQ